MFSRTDQKKVEEAIDLLDATDESTKQAILDARQAEVAERIRAKQARVKATEAVAKALPARTQKVRAQLDADLDAAKDEACRLVAEAQLRAEAGLDHPSIPAPAKVTLYQLDMLRRQHLG
jgi:hypothetical protein